MKELVQVTALSEVDHLVRNLLPYFAQIVGLADHADKIRRLLPIRNKTTVLAAVQILREFGNDADKSKGSQWGLIIRDIAFWSEAAIWTALRDETDCRNCVLIIKREIDAAFSCIVEH